MVPPSACRPRLFFYYLYIFFLFFSPLERLPLVPHLVKIFSRTSDRWDFSFSFCLAANFFLVLLARKRGPRVGQRGTVETLAKYFNQLHTHTPAKEPWDISWSQGLCYRVGSDEWYYLLGRKFFADNLLRHYLYLWRHFFSLRNARSDVHTAVKKKRSVGSSCKFKTAAPFRRMLAYF